MSDKMFFTGFPGFLGRELLKRQLLAKPATRAICLVQKKFLADSNTALRDIEEEAGIGSGRVDLVVGDIAEPGLGMAGSAEVAKGVTEIFHLAAIYDLSVPRALAQRVNVDGTRHMLDFAKGCESLRRFHHVSTCYVSGRYPGIFTEKDLKKGQAFNNHYEETKYLSEVLVREAMDRGLPGTVYRPSVVVGDSRTGETIKYDGPYTFIRWLLRQPLVATVPIIGDPSRFRFNIVPRDYVLDALTYLSLREEGRGKTYQLCDHAPFTCEETIELMVKAVGRPAVRVRLNPGVAQYSLRRIPGLESIMQIPATMIDYMRHPTHYLNEATRADLEPSGIAPPPFSSYVGNMVRFVREHMDVSTAGLS